MGFPTIHFHKSICDCFELISLTERENPSTSHIRHHHQHHSQHFKNHFHSVCRISLSLTLTHHHHRSTVFQNVSCSHFSLLIKLSPRNGSSSSRFCRYCYTHSLLLASFSKCSFGVVVVVVSSGRNTHSGFHTATLLSCVYNTLCSALTSVPRSRIDDDDDDVVFWRCFTFLVTVFGFHRRHRFVLFAAGGVSFLAIDIRLAHSHCQREWSEFRRTKHWKIA